jgi:hypothetical protein
MLSRVLFTVLALVLFWSGYPGHQNAVALPAAGHAETAWIDMPTSMPDAGSVDEHHLDELPSQSLAEAQFDPPGLIREGHDVRVPVLAAAPPTPFSMADLRPPYLDAPQRPPSAHSVA